jgi:hypothetical protein
LIGLSKKSGIEIESEYQLTGHPVDGSVLKKYTNRDKLSYLLFWGNERRQKAIIPHLRHITLPPGFLDNCKDILTMKAEALGTTKNRVVQLSMDEVGTFFSICAMGWKDF